MKNKKFSHDLRRGLGRAILELKNSADKAAYRDIVLRCCLRDIAYDFQMEGSKGAYLYTAICALGAQDSFEPLIIKKFLMPCNGRLMSQLCSILCCYSKDGSQSALNALRDKYDYFAAKGGRLNQNLAEEYQWAKITDSLMDITGFQAFTRHALDAGEILRKKQVNEAWYYVSLIDSAREKFGKKRVSAFLEKMYPQSRAIKALVDARKADELDRQQHLEKPEQMEKLSVQDIYKLAKEAACKDRPRLYAGSFMRNASEMERIELAKTALQETDKTIKALLLSAFRYRHFPLEITPLIEYAQSDHSLLSEIAIACLEEFKDKRVHDLAIRLLQEKGLDSFALGLLVKNYKKSDDGIINAVVKKSVRIPHHVQMDMGSIFMRYRSANVFPALFRVYEKGDCSYCRDGIVKAMNHCGVLSDDILNECLHDFWDDIRQYAKRILMRRCLTADQVK